MSPKEKRERAEHMSRVMKEKWDDPEFADKMRKQRSEIMKEKWEDQEYRAKQEAERKERGKDPEFRKKISDKLKVITNTPQWKARLKKQRAKDFADPEYRERHHQMTKDTAKQRGDKMKSNWADPKFAFNMMEARIGRAKALDYIEQKFSLEDRRMIEDGNF